jgi:hypothetical protein
VFNKKIKVCLGGHDHPMTGHVMSCKRLRDKGLHTFLGMVGYCMKDKRRSILSVFIIMSSYDMNEG